MASFRRTLSPVLSPSPYRHAPSLTPLSLSSPSHKFLSAQKPSLPLSLSDFLSAAFPLKHLRRSHLSWRRSLSSRCLLFFLLGILLGFISFRQTDDFTPNDDFSFDVKPQPKTIHADKIGLVSFNDWAINDTPRDLLIVVTPTYNRALQAYYLNRLGQVLRLVNAPLLWIVVEMEDQSVETAEILRKTSVMYRHLVCSRNMTDFKDRGVQQRNAAIEHIERHRLDGIVYFADDDNVYTLELFERVREISRFGTWPVAMLAQSKSKAVLEGAVCDEGQVIGWHTNEKSKRLRRFHVDMSGFAFNSTILWDPRRWRRPYFEPIRQLDTVREGFQETTFIEQLVADESQMEGVPVGCDRILNWHLHLDAQGFSYPRGWALEDYLVAVEPLDR